MSKYGENIKKIRSVRGLTQAQLADIIDVSRAVISSYEEGRAEPKIETIIKTADVFQVTVDSLLKKNITVNQLSGFTVPDILKDRRTIAVPKELEAWTDLFPADLMVIKSENLKENTFCKQNDLVFGLKDSPVKNKMFVVELNGESLIGRITQHNQERIVLGEKEILLQDVERTIKVIGIYQPVEDSSPLEDRLLLMEKRIQVLEGKLQSI